tara:strand:+ start:196 stop:1146 length:951 start_codon:yes stop_codon:yes gene_type:complete
MNICEKKNQIQDLLNDIYSEYNRMNESKIQNKCETDLEMRTMINNIRSLETNSLEKDSRIKSLEKTIFDYEKIIENLSEKLELKEEYDRENNRHDMLRILSKDISEKDREIDRLNGLLNFHKKEKSKSKTITNLMENIPKKDTNNIILNELSLEDNSNIQLECEPSPGGIIHSNDEVLHLEPEPSNTPTPNTPTPIPSPETIKNNSEETNNTNETNETNNTNETDNTNDTNETDETDETNETTDNTENTDSNEIDNLVDEENIKTLMRVKSKGQYYFVYKEDDPEQDVYEYNEEKRADKIIGKRTRINGKWSWKLF